MTPLDSDSEHDEFWQWGNIKELITRSTQTFLSALPLFSLWLMIPFGLLILNSFYQSGQLLSERNDRVRVEKEFYFVGENSENLTLHISFPKKIRIEMDKPYDDSMSLWITGPISNTPQGQVLAAYTFSLAFEDESADFMDEKGNPIPGIMTLSPARDNSASELLYLKSNPASFKENENIIVIVDNFLSPSKSYIIPIPVEGQSQSRIRHFFDAIFSLPTLIGGLLTAIAGFGFQQWKEMNDEVQRKKDEEAKQKQDIDEETYKNLDVLLNKSDHSQAFERYQKYLQDVEKANPRVNALFENRISQAIKYEFDRLNFSDAINLYELIKKANIENLKKDWEYQKSRKLNELLIRDKSKATKLIDKLQKKTLASANEITLYKDLEKGVAFVKLGQLLKPWPEFIMEGNEFFPREDVDIKRGMDFMRIDANPFGFEKVEKDLHFNGRFDRIIWKRGLILEDGSILALLHDINAIYPVPIGPTLGPSQLMLGSKGSGKTAMALLLAGVSFFLKEKTIPIYCKIYSVDTFERLLRQIVMSMLNYYVSNSNDFLEHDISHQSAFAVLIANYVAGGPELSFRLKLAGLANEPLSQDFHNCLIELVESAKLVKLTSRECARTLLQSYPSEYKRILLLFDYQGSTGKVSSCNKGVIQFMKELQEQCVVKIFSSSSAFSRSVVSQLDLPQIPITWSEDMLKNVLKSRMDNIKLGGVGAFFDPSLMQAAQDLVLKSVDTPGDLIRKGNEILSYIGQNNKKIGIDGANHIFGKSLVNKILKGS